MRIVKVWPEFREDLLATGKVTEGFLKSISEVALGRMHKSLLLASGTQYQRLRKLSREEQDRAIASGVEVLLPGGEVRVIPLDDLTPDQARQAVGRSIAKQRSYLEERKPKPERISDQQYRVHRGYVETFAPIRRISTAMLLQWAQETQTR